VSLLLLLLPHKLDMDAMSDYQTEMLAAVMLSCSQLSCFPASHKKMYA
jgi:hypothetical protein